MANQILSDTSELRRIDVTGVLWFGAAALATAVTIGGALAESWSPDHLHGVLAVAWWVAAGLVVLALGALAWSGCPVFGDNVAHADRDKSITIRAGVVVFILAGSGAAVIMLATS